MTIACHFHSREVTELDVERFVHFLPGFDRMSDVRSSITVLTQSIIGIY